MADRLLYSIDNIEQIKEDLEINRQRYLVLKLAGNYTIHDTIQIRLQESRLKILLQRESNND